jgi:hypothetical protein
MKFEVEVYEPDVDPGGHTDVFVVEASDEGAARLKALTEGHIRWPKNTGLVVSSVKISPEQEKAYDLDRPDRGIKYNKLKNRLSLVTPFGIWLVGEVGSIGEIKYDTHNNRKGIPVSELLDALDRHTKAFVMGEDLDPETGLPHMAHAAWNALSIVEQMFTHPEMDDRYQFTAETRARFGLFKRDYELIKQKIAERVRAEKAKNAA